MCYRCDICNAVVGPKVSLTRHVISREVPKLPKGLRTEIAKEVPVCQGCKNLLDSGLSIRQAQNFKRPKPAIPPKPVALSTPSPLAAESIL